MTPRSEVSVLKVIYTHKAIVWYEASGDTGLPAVNKLVYASALDVVKITAHSIHTPRRFVGHKRIPRRSIAAMVTFHLL